MTVLEINKLTVKTNASRKHSHYLLNNVSCNIDAGEILAVIGSNGAGKSTLLNAVAGERLGHTVEGSITIANETSQQHLARQLAVLPQQSLLNFPYRVHEVVALSRIPHKSGNTVDEIIIDQALTAMDIHFLKDRLYTHLSGGEKQRVQLARVLAQIWRAEDAPNGTRLLLLDEPTSALDLGHQQQLMQAIQEFAKQGVAVMMVLHDINLAARYADKLLALLCSETVAYGTANEVLTPQTIKKLFGIDVEVMFHPTNQTPIIINK